jgi:hypothetical protein
MQIFMTFLRMDCSAHLFYVDPSPYEIGPVVKLHKWQPFSSAIFLPAHHHMSYCHLLGEVETDHNHFYSSLNGKKIREKEDKNRYN